MRNFIYIQQRAFSQALQVILMQAIVWKLLASANKLFGGQHTFSAPENKSALKTTDPWLWWMKESSWVTGKHQLLFWKEINWIMNLTPRKQQPELISQDYKEGFMISQKESAL